MAGRTKLFIDFQEALEFIDQHLQRNEDHKKGEWLTKDPNYHAFHAREHLYNFMKTPIESEEIELVSGATRGLMALQRYLEQKGTKT